MKNLKIYSMLVILLFVVSVNIAFSEDRDSNEMRKFAITHPNSKTSQQLVIVPDTFLGLYLQSEDGSIYEGLGGLVKNNSDIPYSIYPRIRSVIVTDTGSQYKPVGYLDPATNKITNDVGLDGEFEPGARKSFLLLFKNIDPLAKSLTFKIKDVSGEPGTHETYVLTATYIKLTTIEKFKKTAIKWSSKSQGMTNADWKQLFEKNKEDLYRWGLTDFTLKPQKPLSARK